MRNQVFRFSILAAVTLLLGCTYVGCAAKQLMEMAQLPEDKADTLVRIFDSYHEAGANLMEHPEIRPKEKRVLADLERPAREGAKALLIATGEYRTVKKQIADIRAGGGSPDNIILTSLGAALKALELALEKHQKPISSFTRAVSKKLPTGTAAPVNITRVIEDSDERLSLMAKFDRTGAFYDGTGAMALAH